MKIYIDGSRKRNGTYGYCVVEEGKEPFTFIESGDWTSNEMEYRGLMHALEIAPAGATILTDSQLLVGHVTKGWKVNYPHLRPYVVRAKELVWSKNITLQWIPREQNLAGKVFE